MIMAMPNFLIIGAPRTSTTTLYEMLIQHPQIYMSSRKEPWFFALEGRDKDFQGPVHDQGVRSLESYQALFNEVNGETAVGEASTLYLHSPQAPHRIKHYIPDAKLIVILRNPVDRAYSNFMQHVGQGREKIKDFKKAIAAEPERRQKDWQPFWFYQELGFYGEHLSRYYSLFKPEQIKVLLYEDICNDLPGILKSLFQFLDVDPQFNSNIALKHNASGEPRSKKIHSLLTQSNPVKRFLKPIIPRKGWRKVWTRLMNQNLQQSTVTPSVRQKLVEDYREDILKTQVLIGRDLSAWLQ